MHSESTNARRKLLADVSKNLAAVPATANPDHLNQSAGIGTTRSSGALPAVAGGKNDQPNGASVVLQTLNDSTSLSVNTSIESRSETFASVWKYIIVATGTCALLIISIVIFCMCRNRKGKAVSPWKTGLSGQLQKAFVTGVPKLNRAELETACEDFSNIISNLDGCAVYKGTLSNGVEIAVATTTIASAEDWSKTSEKTYRKKIDTLSRVNHKNFVNLLGYCEEEEPFCRMMVFEYAPNGSLYEHLHVKDMEHLDWNGRTRIIMGTAYCLQTMHELNPPVSLACLSSSNVLLTDDYAAKIVDASFWKSFTKKSGQDDSLPDLETNVFSFGILMLEIISGKLPQSDEYGSILNWANEHLLDKQGINNLVDPTLKSFKDNELDQICDVIVDCIQPEPKKRPVMKDVISKLREVIAISPEAATPKLSPLWWAELEILSVEAG
uniref:Protein kinase domain-containing protein n=1 Tax=Kalanchoe fedtschenkoi TaxID=63787 RepID=A0A7N0TWE2_KALFE